MTRRSTRASTSPTGRTPRGAETGVPFVAPYPPSWVDRLTDGIDRLPIPAWATATVGLVGLLVFVRWREGDYRLGFQPYDVLFNATPVVFLAIIHHLKRVATPCLERFNADSSGGAKREANYRLCTLPRLPALVLGVGATVLFLAVALVDAEASDVPFALFVLTIAWTFSALLLFLVHEIRTVRRLLRGRTEVDLYDPSSLYTFSPLTARAAAIVTLFMTALVWGQPVVDATSLALYAIMVTLGLFLFAWPLWGAHGLLVFAKKRALVENAAQFKAAAAELHRRVVDGRLSDMDNLNKTLSSLEIEQAALRRIPTWPWEPTTLRGLLAAVLLPILIWPIQFGLQRVLE